jgi:RNA polymerase sigma-70 factor (ECF subfamily)
VTTLATFSDEDLFEAVSGGDEAAFAALVDRHLPKVLALATRMTGSHAEADDVAQEALLRVWTRGSLWRPGSAKFGTWLHRVTMNLCIDRLRRRTFQPIEDAETLPDQSSDPASDAESSELKRAVEAALDALPGKQKAAIVLCHYEGFTGKEAAAILGISVLAVQSLLVRARSTLRQTLAGYADDAGGPHDE